MLSTSHLVAHNAFLIVLPPTALWQLYVSGKNMFYPLRHNLLVYLLMICF